MDSQMIINALFSIVGFAFGLIIKRMWDADTELATKVQAIEVLVAGEYVKRAELDNLGQRLFERLDRIESKLDKKMDK